MKSRKIGNKSSSPDDSNDVILNDECSLSSMHSGTFFIHIANYLKIEKLGELLKKVRKRFASLEKEKELVSLTQKLNEIEIEKVVGFPLRHSSVLS